LDYLCRSTASLFGLVLNHRHGAERDLLRDRVPIAQVGIDRLRYRVIGLGSIEN
jgi:hypothetical protein